jgi:hypothetical protein
MGTKMGTISKFCRIEALGEGCKRLKEKAPQVGLEPTTLRLTAGCSAIELLRSNGTDGQNHRDLRRLAKAEKHVNQRFGIQNRLFLFLSYAVLPSQRRHERALELWEGFEVNLRPLGYEP